MNPIEWIRQMVAAYRYGFDPQIITPPKGNLGGEVIPDRISVEPIVGYRVWNIHNSGLGLRFASISMSYKWLPGENTAVCMRKAPSWVMPPNYDRHPGRKAPDPSCQCGLYAQLPDHPISEWQHSTRGHVHASGTVAMSGRIIKCERGWKAEHAVIQSPVVLEASCMVRPDGEPCENTPTWVQIPDSGHYPYWTVCDRHKEHEPRPAVQVEAAGWMRAAAEELSETYNLEVLTWLI